LQDCSFNNVSRVIGVHAPDIEADIKPFLGEGDTAEMPFDWSLAIHLVDTADLNSIDSLFGLKSRQMEQVVAASAHGGLGQNLPVPADDGHGAELLIIMAADEMIDEAMGQRHGIAGLDDMVESGISSQNTLLWLSMML